MAMNLRGIKESGKAFAVPTYLFMVAHRGHGVWGFVQYALGDLPVAESAQYDIIVRGAVRNGLSGIAMVFLLARAFSSGCAALTGVEAISNGVPAFQKPKSRNAATTLLLLGVHRRDDAHGHHRARRPHATAVRRGSGASSCSLNGEPVGRRLSSSTR